MVAQRTLRNSIQGTGIGLHSGEKVSVTLHPAPADTGIIFRRADLPNRPEIPAWVENVVETTLCTTLGVNGIKVATVEHLMAALAGLGIDNAYVDIDGAEVPIMDGSAAPFVFLLQCAGVHEQDAPKRFLRIKKRVQVTDGDRRVSFEPANALRIDFAIDFDHPLMRNNNRVTVDFSETAFTREVSRARTFGFARDVERLQEQGMTLGGNLDNAIVVDDHRLLNEEGLRYHDEFVRHKVLDAIGDLYLMGHPVLGCFQGHKSGHALNNRLLRALLADASAWELVEREESAMEPRPYLDPLPTH
ncbi:MAG TPA: UDP-3-O-acyl-N-acetylglucosamine deacetylase [Gammaproteobacteria bacterium]|nr:UDP-3-O-acyl-N-acetylglucosamine deacetylase [Gammaproteobacteria bacterium]